MSLLATASPWLNTPSTQPSKKRIPTIKKTKIQESFSSSAAVSSPPAVSAPSSLFSYSNYDNEGNKPDEHVQIAEKSDANSANSKIIELVENMSNMNVSNEGDSLFNYRPSSYVNDSSSATASTATLPPVSVPIFQRRTENTTFQMDNSHLFNAVNYSNAYEIPKDTRPYYAKQMGINTTDSFEEKMLDKIQYLTHLVEEMQNERTANITEEYILYTMLGVFVIYVVDVFSKNGRYVR